MREVELRYNVRIEIGKEVINNIFKKVVILGNDNKEIERAKDEIYYKKNYITVDNRDFGLVVGEDESNLKYFEKISKVHSVTYEFV